MSVDEPRADARRQILADEVRSRLSVDDPERHERLMRLWTAFWSRWGVLEAAVPLFETDEDLRVQTIRRGKPPQALFLRRAGGMEAMVRREASRVVDDHRRGAEGFDGLIYIMFWKQGGRVSPLYIGKAGRFGRQGDNLSANIERALNSTHHFCRWGDGYEYHIGDLSAVTCPDHPEAHQKSKYAGWARALFEEVPSEAPRLKAPVWFWMSAWDPGQAGIWEDFGPTPLSFLEYLLIGVGGMLFPSLLNTEGASSP